MTKDRVIFFGSGEFPVKTFERITEPHDNYEIVGLVTTHKSSKLFKKDSPIGKETLLSIAYKKNIPVICFDEQTEDEVYNFCQKLSPDILCVISFKKLSDRFLKLPTKTAFNIHASLLPLLRGSSPINYALLYNFKNTGLTAFILNDKIDSGNILSTRIVDVMYNDDFGSLFWKMSDVCIELTENVILNLSKDHCSYINNSILQAPAISDHPFFVAPKITSNYLEHWQYGGIDNCLNLLRSVSPIDGLHVTITVIEKETQKKLKTVEAKIIKAHKALYDELNTTAKHVHDFTDGKNFAHIIIYNPLDSYDILSIDAIQVCGKKEMHIKEFLRGFQVWVNEKNEIIYDDYYLIKQ